MAFDFFSFFIGDIVGLLCGVVIVIGIRNRNAVVIKPPFAHFPQTKNAAPPMPGDPPQDPRRWRES